MLASPRSLAIGLWFIGVVAITVFLSFELLPLPDKVMPLPTMEFSQDSATTATNMVQLPDNWRGFPDRSTGLGTYRAHVEVSNEAGEIAVFIPSYTGNATIRLNGFDLQPVGHLRNKARVAQADPFFAVVPEIVLLSAVNSLEVRLSPAGPLVAFLGPVYFGAEDLLRPSFAWHQFRAIHLPFAVLIWQILLSGLLILLWETRRHEQAALYCSLLLAISAFHNLPIILPQSFVLTEIVISLGLVTNLWLCVFGLLFASKFTEMPLPIKERYILIVPVVFTLAFAAVSEQLFNLVNQFIVVPISLIIVIGIFYYLILATVRDRKMDAAIVLASTIFSIAFVIHDVLIISDPNASSDFLHFRVAYIVILPGLSLVFAQRFIKSLNEVDLLVKTMESRISEREQKFQETSQQRQILEERQRIIRDVHDGLGGQLMSIIAMAESKEPNFKAFEDSARSALEDLRMMINSLGVDDDVSGVLGTFRERAEAQLAVHGIQLEWKMIEIPPMEGITPTDALNILRVMQEAITNAARHSGADLVTIGFGLEKTPSNTLTIDIKDNGNGFNADQVSEGYGLRNMHMRAEELAGSLKVTTNSAGTQLLLCVPANYSHKDNAMDQI